MFEGHTEPHRGRQGSSRQGWSKVNVRAIIFDLWEDNPKASRDKLTRLLYDRIGSDEDAGMSACDWLIALCEGSWRSNKERAEQNRKFQKAAEIRTEATIETIRQQFLLLNWQMPNGKRLRFCDGNYVASLGGALAKAGKKAGNKMMGEVFNEDDLREYVTV